MTQRRFLAASARALVVGLLLVASGCAIQPTIRTDFDASVDFGRFRTYSWAYSGTPTGMNPLLFQRVQDSIDRTLRTRFTPAQPGDFAVAFTLGRRDTVQVTDLGLYGPGWRSWGWWGPGWRGSNIDVRNVTNGTLVIDIFDTATKRPVWHGVATQEINPNRPPNQAQIDSAIAQVLTRFPPQPETR